MDLENVPDVSELQDSIRVLSILEEGAKKKNLIVCGPDGSGKSLYAVSLWKKFRELNLSCLIADYSEFVSGYFTNRTIPQQYLDYTFLAIENIESGNGEPVLRNLLDRRKSLGKRYTMLTCAYDPKELENSFTPLTLRSIYANCIPVTTGNYMDLKKQFDADAE